MNLYASVSGNSTTVPYIFYSIFIFMFVSRDHGVCITLASNYKDNINLVKKKKNNINFVLIYLTKFTIFSCLILVYIYEEF